MNGADQERALMAVLRAHQFVPMRSPGSGTGDWEQPDVLAADDGVTLAVELKSGGAPSNVQEHEVAALRTFADAFRAAAMVAVRYKGDRTFYLTRPQAMERTPSAHYSVPSAPQRLPWSIALPYRRTDDGVVPTFNTDDGVRFASADVTPDLRDWLDALTAAQRGRDIRRGVLSRKYDERQESDADGSETDPSPDGESDE
jgi:Holliday junction resolvase